MGRPLTSRKSQPEINPLVRHINEWHRVSQDERDKKMGENWFQEVESFYGLAGSDSSGELSFRPKVSIPELQVLMLQEANDLSEASPRVYIVNQDTQDEPREKAFQAQWRQMMMNFHILMANLWALFGGVGLVQIGFDPYGRNGKGELWTKARNPKTFFPDPTTDYELDWSYVIIEDYLHLEEVRKRWPDTSVGLKGPSMRTSNPSSLIAGSNTRQIQLPAGPMETVPIIPSTTNVNGDTRCRIRWVFCKDYTRDLVSEKKLPPGSITSIPKFEWKYPNGRLIVECEGDILQDGDNPYPMGMFPIVPFWSMPPLLGFWTAPAIKLSKGLQSLSERMMTNVFENAVRMNNGIWFIDESTGIDLDEFGGIPAEAKIINRGSPTPQAVYPGAMPQQYVDLPMSLLALQKELQGFSASRQGQPGAGNISADLFDQSVLRSQGMTQLRGRLASLSIQRIADLMFYTMARYFPNQKLPLSQGGQFEVVDWKRIDRPDQYDVYLDESSIRPLSQAAIRRIIPDLMKAGYPLGRAMEAFELPGGKEVDEEVRHQAELAALAKVQRRK